MSRDTHWQSRSSKMKNGLNSTNRMAGEGALIGDTLRSIEFNVIFVVETKISALANVNTPIGRYEPAFFSLI